MPSTAVCTVTCGIDRGGSRRVFYSLDISHEGNGTYYNRSTQNPNYLNALGGGVGGIRKYVLQTRDARDCR